MIVTASATGSFALHGFYRALPLVVVAVLAVLAVTWVCSRIAGRNNVIDTAWGLFFCAAAGTAFVVSAGEGNALRRWLLLAMTLCWGLRLAVHVGRRSLGKGEDPRYADLLRDRGPVAALAWVYGLQGVLAFLISLPIVTGCFLQAGLTPLAWIGVAIWLAGVGFEAVGDWQLERYKAAKAAGEPVHQVLDTGLWRYTRHPNYFGDACVWVGIFCVSAERWPGVLTVFAPAVMVYLLAFGSGKRVLERSMAARPGYRDYMARTSGFLPRPPRAGAGVS